jgi:hypothetical protein
METPPTLQLLRVVSRRRRAEPSTQAASVQGYLTAALGAADQARRVVAKVEWQAGELFPRVGFLVTNLKGRCKRVVRFYNARGTAEQGIKEEKNAVKWTKLTDTPAGSLHSHPVPSPDGKWLVYGSKREDVRQLYLLRLDDKKE